MNKLICIFPNLKNYSGHENSFIPALNKFSSIEDYNSFYITPRNKLAISNKLNDHLPDFDTFRSKPIHYCYKFIKTLHKLFTGKNYNSDLVFLDGYSNYQLLLISVFFYFKRLKLDKILVYYRIDISKNFFKFYLYKLCFFLLHSKQGRKLIVLTDNENLNLEFQKVFSYYSSCMPIPHIIKISKTSNNNNLSMPIYIWSPGPLRSDKGIENIISIAKNINIFSAKLKILISDDFKKYYSSKKDFITYLNNNLDDQEYLKILEMSDIILLPYNHPSYKTRTSGIFFESISARKFVVVSENTWMADELRKNNLDCLIIKDWTLKKVISFIEKNYNNPSIIELIKNMSIVYEKTHGIDNFCQKLKKVINK